MLSTTAAESSRRSASGRASAYSIVTLARSIVSAACPRDAAPCMAPSMARFMRLGGVTLPRMHRMRAIVSRPQRSRPRGGVQSPDQRVTQPGLILPMDGSSGGNVDTLQVSARFPRIAPDKLSEFKRIVGEAVAMTKEEPGCLQYDWFLSADETVCH